MKLVGNKLMVRRNRNDVISFRLQYENGEPLVFASGWDNPYFIMTIASSRYVQDERYIKTWWMPLSHLVRVTNTEIYLDTDSSGVPTLEPQDWAYTQVIKTIEGYYWYSDGSQWRPYDAPTIAISFTVQDASEWIEHNYKWDCSIVAGTLSTGTGDNSPPLKDFVVVKTLIEDALMEVSSDSLGGLI